LALLHEAVLNEVLSDRVVSSRGRRNQRGVKKKMTSYNVRRKAKPLQQGKAQLRIIVLK